MHKHQLTFIFFIILLLLAQISFAQELTTKSQRAIRFFEEGRSNFNLKYFDRAEKALLKAISADDQFIEARLLLADVFKSTNRSSEALRIYDQVIAINDTTYPEVYYFSGLIHFNQQHYETAVIQFERYLDIGSGQQDRRDDAGFYAACAAFAKNAIANPVEFSPQNIGKGVNTPNDEYINAVKADGLTLYFTGRKSKDRNLPGGDDFYFSKRASVDEEWGPSVKLGPPVNTSGDEGALTISPDGRYLLFAGCQWPDGYGSCDIFVSKLTGGRPQTPVNMGSRVNTGAWESQPSLSSDGRTMYFASARHGGYGKSDLYKTYLQDDGTWTQPENLGPVVNTTGSDMAPFIHPDGQTLYFSSDRHVGMGGIDLFVTRMDSTGKWSEPLNLGYPLNTPGDEINVVVDAPGEKGFISAEKLGGFGGYDIFEFELHDNIRPIPSTYMKGVVSDAVTGKPLEAYFSLLSLESQQEIVRSFSDPETGEFLVCIPTDRQYALNVSKERYLFFSENFSLSGLKSVVEPYLMNIRLNPITAGKSIVLRNIFFDSGEFTLREESVVELQKLLEFLELNEQVKIEIEGHTDNVGTDAFNKTLSENRARAVYEFLIEHGIDAERLKFLGYGFSKPISDNDSPEGRAKNRRTEITVIGTNQ